MGDVPLPLTNHEADLIAAWIEKKKGLKVILDRHTALKVAATLRWVATENTSKDR